MQHPLNLITFAIVVSWLMSIFVTTDPDVRMQRVCLPVEYTGKLATSMGRLDSESTAGSLKNMFDKGTLGCKKVMWDVVYGDDWRNRSKDVVSNDSAAASSAQSASAPEASTPKDHKPHNKEHKHAVDASKT